MIEADWDDRVLRPTSEQAHFIEELGLAFELTGMPRMAGRIAAWLLICQPPEQTTLQLEAAVGASKASVSTLTRLLIRIGLIEQVAVAGERRQVFRARANGVEAVHGDSLEQTRRMRRVLEQGQHLVEGQPAAERKRITDWVAFYGFLEEELGGMIERWRRRAGQETPS